MDFQDLRVFVAVYETCNFVNAGTALSISQSGVSWRMRRLEGEFEGKLFERLQRGVRPTAAGDKLYRYALRIMALLDETGQAFSLKKHAA